MLGAGYIAVEMAGIFHGLGSDTHLFFRGQTVRPRGYKRALALARSGSHECGHPPLQLYAHPLAWGHPVVSPSEPGEERRALAAWVPRRGCGGAPAPPKLADSTTFGAGQVLRLTLALPFP